MTCQKNLNRRWCGGLGYATQPLMGRAVAKFGWENVEHEVISSGMTKAEAEEVEISLIAQYRSDNPLYGYNVEHGGACTGTHSEETKRKIGEAQKGEKNHNWGKPHPMRGKKMSAEFCAKNREAHLGQKSYWKGKHLPPEVVEKLRKPKSEETKRKLSEVKSVPVMCVETGVVYKSGKDAADTLGISRGTIAKVVRGIGHTAGGFHWVLANSDAR